MTADVADPAFRVAFIGGGSGGHLVPAIAIVEQLRALLRRVDVLFLTSTREIDAKVLATADWTDSATTQIIPYVTLQPRLRFGSGIRHVAGAWRSLRTAKQQLTSFRPDVVIGLGAFASVPGVIAASRLKIPVVLLEQNAIPGRANRSLASRAHVTVAGFDFVDHHRERWPGQIEPVGVPLRNCVRPSRWSPEIPDTGRVSPSKPERLLVLGGSQGAVRLNRLVIAAMESDPGLLRDWQLIHQTGDSDRCVVEQAYARQGRGAISTEFLADLPTELSKATLVISRAGAGTLHELAMCRCPAVLIPLSSAADGHQAANASVSAACGAALVIDERRADAGTQLRRALTALSAAEGQAVLHQMSKAQWTLARPDAAARAAELIVAAASDHGRRSGSTG